MVFEKSRDPGPAQRFNATSEQWSPARWTGEWGRPALAAIDRALGERNPAERAPHGHGFVMEGHFEPATDNERSTKRLRELTSFGPFEAACPAVTRFSNLTAELDRPDIMGMATQLRPDEGEESHFLALSLDVFPAAHPRDFIALVEHARNRRRLGPRVAALVATGRVPLSALWAAARARRVDHGVGHCTTFHGIQTFRLVKEPEGSTPMRYRWRPDDENEAGYYRDVVGRPPERTMPTARFHLELLVKDSRAGLSPREQDRLDDPRFAWEPPYEVIPAGTLTLDRTVTDPPPELRFEPTTLAPGIIPGDSPLFSARQAAATQSFVRRRNGELAGKQ